MHILIGIAAILVALWLLVVSASFRIAATTFGILFCVFVVGQAWNGDDTIREWGIVIGVLLVMALLWQLPSYRERPPY